MQPEPDRSKIHNTIVSYSNVVEPFGSLDNFLQQTRNIAVKVIKDPAQLDATMVDFAQGMGMWRDSQVDPHVLHTSLSAKRTIPPMVPSTSMKSPLRRENSPDARVLPVALAFSVGQN
jgi:hypothetical protein